MMSADIMSHGHHILPHCHLADASKADSKLRAVGSDAARLAVKLVVAMLVLTSADTGYRTADRCGGEITFI